MEKNKKLQGIKDIIETAELLLASRGEYQKTINVIFESALRISGAHRACLIIKNKKGELIIKKGGSSVRPWNWSKNYPRYRRNIFKTGDE